MRYLHSLGASGAGSGDVTLGFLPKTRRRPVPAAELRSGYQQMIAWQLTGCEADRLTPFVCWQTLALFCFLLAFVIIIVVQQHRDICLIPAARPASAYVARGVW